MSDGTTCYERDETLCEDPMCARTGCRIRNERLAPLLPCPFCGSSNVRCSPIRDGSNVQCRDCFSTGPAQFSPNASAKAIEAWNWRALAANPPDPDSMNDKRALEDDGPYLVWSNQHRAWWRGDSHGYTDNVKAAGRYSRAEAISISFRGRDGWDSPKGVPDELAIAESDVPVFTAAPTPTQDKPK